MLRAMLTSVLTIPLYINNNQHWLFMKEESVVRNCVCVCACMHVNKLYEYTYLRVKGDNPQGPHRGKEEKGKTNLNDVSDHNAES